jgi:hypothetical protein
MRSFTDRWRHRLRPINRGRHSRPRRDCRRTMPFRSNPFCVLAQSLWNGTNSGAGWPKKWRLSSGNCSRASANARSRISAMRAALSKPTGTPCGGPPHYFAIATGLSPALFSQSSRTWCCYGAGALRSAGTITASSSWPTCAAVTVRADIDAELDRLNLVEAKLIPHRRYPFRRTPYR